jgi:hypothetical protein
MDAYVARAARSAQTVCSSHRDLSVVVRGVQGGASTHRECCALRVVPR